MDFLSLGSLTSCAITSVTLLLLLPPLFLIHFLFTNRSRKKQWKLPPGPKKLPIIGNLHQISRLLHRSLHLLSKEHGPLMTIHMGSIRYLIVTSTKFAEEITKTKDLSFASRPGILSGKLLSYGAIDVALAPYGDYWRHSRKLCILEFLSLKKVQSFKSVREEELLEVVDIISQSAGTGVNLSELVLALTTNLICRVMMGEKYVLGGYSKSRLHGIMKETNALLVSFFFSDNIPVLGWLDSITGLKARLEKNFRDMDSFFEEIIEKHVHRKTDTYSSRDVIDSFLEIQKEGTEQLPLSKERIKAILMNGLIAGTDTTWSVIIWAMAELIRNPNTMKKAQEEVRQMAAGKRRVYEADAEKLEYLKLVVKETLRLHCPVPLLIVRETREDSRVGGYDVPRGTRVSINAWSIMRDPKNWANPEEFKPERFVDRDVDYKGKDFEFIPFGSGRRICPGIHFAMATINMTLANLLYCFDWEMPSGMKAEEMDMSEVFGVTLHKKTDLILVPHPCLP